MCEKTLDAVVAGHICLDMTPSFSRGGSRLGDVLRPGVLEHVGPLTVSTGGAVSNTGLPLLKMGLRTALMGKCGRDRLGQMILNILRDQAPGSQEGMQSIEGQETSYTVVLAVPGLDRVFLHNPGANDTFGPEDIRMETVSRARLFHFGYSSLMERMYTGDGEQLTEIFRTVKQAGLTTSLDTSCPPVQSRAAGADWNEIFRRTLPHVDLFLPSAEELLLLLDREKYLELEQRAGDAEVLGLVEPEMLSQLGRRCLEYGAGVVLIKCGHMGIYARTAGVKRLEACHAGQGRDLSTWADRELMVPSFDVGEVVSATGAGDCAIAGFLAGWLEGTGLDEALHLACGAGAQNVTVPDSVSGIRALDETRQWLASRPPRRPVEMDLEAAGWKWDPQKNLYYGPAD
jgi:sugar/nucleoside kinase (ribokinase family)